MYIFKYNDFTVKNLLIVERSLGLILLLILFGGIYYLIDRAKKGNIPQLRKLPVLSVVDEAIGRAIEMGRPVHFTPGSGDLTSGLGPMTLAGISVLNYVARQSARNGAELIVTTDKASNYPISQETVRTSYVMEGHAEAFKSEMVRFAPGGFAWDVMIMGIADEERPAANIMIGAFYHTAIYLIDVMAAAGALQVAGTARTGQLPILASTAEYCLIGEEIYVAGAYLNKDEILSSSFVAQDLMKVICFILVLLEVILSSFGIDILTNLM